ncbi:hypothetical protein [Calothrix sp. NIES-2098]|uniref:hypothetical protein n=1 Tax=Calothrix sp. NIES-2098 TaxID=1954171 RepID=UPI0030D9031B
MREFSIISIVFLAIAFTEVVYITQPSNNVANKKLSNSPCDRRIENLTRVAYT